MTTNFETDVVIIGAGPSGLFSVFECGMLGLKCHVIDSLDHIGGQCIALYPEKPIYDIPALPEIMAADLISNLEKQAAPFRPVYHLSQQVTTISGKVNYFTITTRKDVAIKAKAIIIAGGTGSFGPQKPPLANLENYEGVSVFYAVRSREKFRDRSVVIAGGGDSAIDWAISLSEVAKKVSLVHRRDKFRGAQASVDKLHALAKQGKIDLVVPYQLEALEGDNNVLKTVIVSDLDHNRKTIDADILLPFFGLSTSLGPLADWGLGLSKNHIEIDQATAKTNLDGIYAVGDMATYPHKVKLILTGFAEAAQAAHSIRHQIFPDEELHFEYSTTKGVPGSVG